jgi:hypothetical protein
MVDELIALIISTPGKLLHEPLELIISNADMITIKINEKIINSIGLILTFQLENSAVEKKYPQFCYFALFLLEKTVLKDWPMEIKIE